MNLNDIKIKTNELTAKRAGELEEINAQVKASQSILETAQNALRKAQEAGDAKAYAKAANEARTAGDVLAMYNKQLTSVEASPVITEEQYQDLKRQIYTAMEELTEETTAEYLNAMKAVQALFDRLVPAIETANDLLHKVQRDLRKVPTVTITPEGHHHIRSENMDDIYKNPGVHGALYKALSNDFYQANKEGK